MVTTSQFKKMILDNNDKLTKLDFKTKVSKFADYKFIIHDIRENSLNIVIFIRYEQLIASVKYKEFGLRINGYPLENQLMKLISPDANSLFNLKMDAKIKKPKLFKEEIIVEIDDFDYTFKISGAGEHAIKLSHKITYEYINQFDDPVRNPLENKLKNIIYFICTNKEKTWDMSYFEILKLLN